MARFVTGNKTTLATPAGTTLMFTQYALMSLNSLRDIEDDWFMTSPFDISSTVGDPLEIGGDNSHPITSVFNNGTGIMTLPLGPSGPFTLKDAYGDFDNTPLNTSSNSFNTITAIFDEINFRILRLTTSPTFLSGSYCAYSGDHTYLTQTNLYSTPTPLSLSTYSSMKLCDNGTRLLLGRSDANIIEEYSYTDNGETSIDLVHIASHTFNIPESTGIGSIQFSPDGKTLLIQSVDRSNTVQFKY